MKNKEGYTVKDYKNENIYIEFTKYTGELAVPLIYLYSGINDISKRLKKLESLTKADDYEFVTETKLVKKTK